MNNLFRVAAVVIGISAILGADTLRLKNGTRVEGTYLGGDSRQVRFVGPDGASKTYSLSDVSGIEFGSSVSTASSSAASTSSSSSSSIRDRSRRARAASSVTIPQGTQVTVRMIDTIDSKAASPGAKFRASLDEPIVVGGSEVAPRGADCTVEVVRSQEGGRLSGRSEMAIRLADITVNTRTYPVETSYAELKSESETKNTAVKTLGGAALGAAIGAIAGGGKGAAIGAGAGAAAGATLATLKGPELQVPSETRLTFNTTGPININ